MAAPPIVIGTFEKTGDIAYPELSLVVQTFTSSKNGLRAIFCDVKGSLCSANIIVPTECANNKGLPHTLEHLLFTGSEKHPNRGFLDTLSTRCLSIGTNAWTAVDHTCYTYNSAGSESLVTILPVFLDHIFNPTLTDSAFVTEIYHVDGQGREQGVVFCEMQGRESTEDDLLENSMRKMLYPNSSYSYESGGLTPDIATLSNDEIREYHRQFYGRPDLVTILIMGPVDPSSALPILDAIRFPSASAFSSSSAAPISIPFSTPLAPLVKSECVEVYFPTSEENVGSISFGWRGPAVDDNHTRVALEVLTTYLQDNAASPLNQHFVECSSPLASSIDFSFHPFKVSGLEFTFSGVPHVKDSEKTKSGDKHSAEEDQEDGDEEMDEGESGDEGEDEEVEEDEDGEEDEEDGEEEEERSDLFDDGVFREEFLSVLKQVRDAQFHVPGAPKIQDTIRRSKLKLLEGLEDEAFELITDVLLPEILYPASAAASKSIGHAFEAYAILQSLESKPDSFWVELMDEWFLSKPVVEVRMRPSAEKAKELEEKEAARKAEIAARFGVEGLAECQRKLEQALAHNKVNLHESEISAIQAAASSLLASRSDVALPFSAKMELSPLNIADDSQPPILPIQVIRSTSSFVSLRLVFHTEGLTDAQRLLLPLFQECLLCCDLVLPSSLVDGGSSSSEPQRIPYTEVVKLIDQESITTTVGVGLDNRMFGCSAASELFAIFGCAESNRLDRLLKLLCTLLLFGDVTKTRAKVTCTHLISSAVEELRSGDNTCGQLPVPFISFAKTSNDYAICAFKQLPFLRKLKEQLQDNEKQVLDNLSSLRQALFSDASKMLVQIGVPMAYESSDEELRALVANQWLRHIQQYKAQLSAASASAAAAVMESSESSSSSRRASKKARTAVNGSSSASAASNGSSSISPSARGARTKRDASGAKARQPTSNGKKQSAPKSAASKKATSKNAVVEPVEEDDAWEEQEEYFSSPLNIFTSSFAPQPWEINKDTCVVLAVDGVDSAFLTQFVPCQVKRLDPDFWPIHLLSEMINRSEGPLYEAIRGKGYAYDARVEFSAWRGLLYFNLFETSEPARALSEFYRILERLGADNKASGLDVSEEKAVAKSSDFTPFVMQAAVSSLLYRLLEDHSTPPLAIRHAHRAFLLGVKPEDEYDGESIITQIPLEEMTRVHTEYLCRFLQPEKRLTTVVTNPAQAEGVARELEKVLGCSVKVLKVQDLLKSNGRSK